MDTAHVIINFLGMLGFILTVLVLIALWLGGFGMKREWSEKRPEKWKCDECNWQGDNPIVNLVGYGSKEEGTAKESYACRKSIATQINNKVVWTVMSKVRVD